ncbi:MAG: FlgD immunoglobulin-like domain containing protein [Salinibacter sp.]
MRRLLICLCVLGLGTAPALGQEVSRKRLQDLRPVGGGIVSNTVQTLATAGDSLWIGPLLTVYVESKERLFAPDDEVVTNRIVDGRNVVFSLAAESRSRTSSTVWAGLAFDAGGGTIGAGGFLVSTNGGQSFTGISARAALDEPSDTTIAYGTSTLPAVPVTQTAGSAPRDIAIEGRDTVWVAGTRSGLRRWTTQDSTWTRVVLPPDTSTRIEPSQSYNFLVAPPQDDGRGFQNHEVLSVLVDETGTVWAGTLAGVNRSTPADVAPSGDRAWRLFRPDGTPGSLTGQIVWALAEQPRPGRNPVWMATLRAQGGQTVQRTGLTMTPNGGKTFRQPLIGTQVNDVAARRERVYAAAESGLFVSGNQGDTWRSITDVALQDKDEVFPEGMTAESVAVTPSALWVGTTEGLLRLDRANEPRLLPGASEARAPKWRLFRAQVPVNPENPSEQVPDVNTYAYPNPFSPSRDDVVRIVYDVPEPQTVEVNIYDFGMTRVRTLREKEPKGRQEMVWDGTGEDGLRLPTGTYLYTVEVGGRTIRGKILLSN